MPTTQEYNKIENTKHDKQENQCLTDKKIPKATASNRETSTQQHGRPVKSRSHKVPQIYRRKIRERVIHLLALKPYKKLELYGRLQNEGIRKAEQLLIGNILRDIALLRDNAYSLKRYVWNEVNENWPFYTVHQQQQLKLYKLQNLNNLGSSDEIGTLSADNEIENKTCTKRALVEYEEPRASKKRRISHASVRNNMSSNSKENNATNGTAPKFQQNENNSNRKKTVDTVKKVKNNQHKEAIRQTTFADTQNLTVQEPGHSKISTVSANDQTNQHHGPDFTVYEESPKALASISPTNTEVSNYDFSWYTPITSIEQRRQYKADFEIDYAEYVPLLARVDEVRYIFRELPMQLQQVPEGTPEYERIKNRIFLEYERLNSAEEIELKQRFDYLEAKLLHIKQLVDDYDEKWLTEKAVQAAMDAAREYLNGEQ
ncbi:RNA polymerase II elongation factor Ell-like [Zeugodacus cucurbitae]|uniref:RNA polymerase II elongation factor Ell-like n=1 Tax=Zeugodacus cucurbitae TaxID=28588 RepID=UPI0023D8E643|nr:RNA polymerase II elongation factor Ell-like [Zeugodacus cucurbitae]